MSEQIFARRMHRRRLIQAGFAAAAAAWMLEEGQIAFAQSTPATTGSVRLRMETGPGKDVQEAVDAFKTDVPGISIDFTQVDPASAGEHWARLAIDSSLVDLVSI